LNYGTGIAAKLTSIERFYNNFLKFSYFRRPINGDRRQASGVRKKKACSLMPVAGSLYRSELN